MSSNSQTISMGQYLFQRISQLGVKNIIGVPGDFNLFLLDELFKIPSLRWIGACNELNAAYAADGYTRIRGIPSCLVTTYAVGELSAMNGVAGAMAEHAGMIHIVGMPARRVQAVRPLIHHTMYPGMDHDIFIGMSAPIRKTYAKLTDPKTMPAEIDRVIIECVKSRLPVYIYIPVDAPLDQIDAEPLLTPLSTTVVNEDKEAEGKVVRAVLGAIKNAQNPAILGDVLAARHGGREKIKALSDITGFPSYTTPLGKGVIDETSPNFNGLYNGTVSFDGICEAVESSDLVLNIGPLLSDSNTGSFTRDIRDENLIMLAHDHCSVQGTKFEGVHFLPVLTRIIEELKSNVPYFNLPYSKPWTKIEPRILNSQQQGPIQQSYLWQRLGRFLRPNDILLAESGTAQYGLPDAAFPTNLSWITQTFWSSIGYTVGATLGACIAAEEIKSSGRVILVIGEGSLQMTVQEIGTLIRFGFKPIIFVINNDGYAIERAINGPQQGYNDVSPLWDYQAMLSFFGCHAGTNIPSRSFSCRTVEELEHILDSKISGRVEEITMCEIVCGKEDYPWQLTTMIALTRARAKKAAEQEAALKGR